MEAAASFAVDHDGRAEDEPVHKVLRRLALQVSIKAFLRNEQAQVVSGEHIFRESGATSANNA
jgi:hypothetical protein